jgi:hypothetical protein
MHAPFATALIACALIAGNASASMPTDGATLIVQQRTEDGRILLTDRPVPGAVTLRSWTAPAPSPTALPERIDSAQSIGFYGRVPRHIDAQWRSVDEDPVRERIVRETLERERSQRGMQRTSLRATPAAFRGSAEP